MDEQTNKLILYTDENGRVRVNVRFADEDVWLTQDQLAEIYATTQQNISQHIAAIYSDVELEEIPTHKKFLSVRREGFTMDDERLKQGGNRYFHELLQRIRDIRSSERNFYQQVTDIYATSVDYDPRSPMTKQFFATVQNKMHYAVHEHTAAELIYERVDNEKPFVGMTNFKGNYVTQDDVKIAKNYLSEQELQRLNLLTSQFLDYAEFQALERNPMTMAEWIKALDEQIMHLRRNILEGNGTISHKEAIEKAEQEYRIYREREMALLESDFDKVVKQLNEYDK